MVLGLMNKLLSHKTVLFFIFLFLAQYLILKGEFEMYRFSDKKQVYEYGKYISKGFVYIGFILSFFYPLIVGLQNKKDFRKYIVWVILGFLPALYFVVLFALSYQAN